MDVRVRDGKGERTLVFESLGEAYRDLLRFGAELEVLGPPELRERMADASRALAALYGH